jgi:hypothetical protein
MIIILVVLSPQTSVNNFRLASKGSITFAFGYAVWMGVLLSNEFFMSFFKKNSLKMTMKTHSTVKRTFKMHIQNASAIAPKGLSCEGPLLLFCH